MATIVRWSAVLAVLGVLAVLAACSPPEDAPLTPESVSQYRFKGEGAEAFLYAFDECAVTYLDVFASTGMRKVLRGRPLDVAQAFVYFAHYDDCTGENRFGSAAAVLERGEFSVNNSLSGARLSKVFWMEDYDTGGFFELGLDIVWTAEGPLVRVRETWQDGGDGYRFKYRFSGSRQEASARADLSLEGVGSSLSGYGRLFQAQEGVMYMVQENKLPPQVQYFYAEPRVIAPGDSATLYWSVVGQRALVTLEPGIGPVAPEGSLTVSPTETTTYTLTATNRNGSVSADATVYVYTPDPDEDDRPEAATVITLDYSSPELNISPSDVDWFRFTLSAPTTMTVVADIDASALGSPLDAVLGLFDETLNLIALSDDDWDGLDSYLELTLGPGTYYLAVSGYPDFGFTGDHSQFGFYYLSVTGTP